MDYPILGYMGAVLGSWRWIGFRSGTPLSVTAALWEDRVGVLRVGKPGDAGTGDNDNVQYYPM